jgi:proteasome lid subunit RPN8/RPN11
MGDDSFTSSLKAEDERHLSAAIQAALASLRDVFKQTVEPVTWNGDYIAVPLTVDVELPGRGPVGGVDIRPQEEIFLLLHRRFFPHLSPMVRSNRKDFPKSKFPHINPTPKGTAAYFCLHRGSLDAWFAEHTIVELVNRARDWLRDAARNRLIPEGDVFERTLIGATPRTLIYEPQTFLNDIKQRWDWSGNTAGSCVVAYDLLDDEKQAQLGETGYNVVSAGTVLPGLIEQHLKIARLLNTLARDYPTLEDKYQRRLFGLLLWTEHSKINHDYFGELPETLGDFIAWSESVGVPAASAFDDYIGQGLHLFAGVPVTIAVRRPAKIIGTDSDIELVNFLVSAGGDHWPKDGKWDVAAHVNVSDHRIPLTPQFARKISALDENVEIEKTLVFGSGALGSKLALHLGRSGNVNLTLVDRATLSPHNLVRHALSGERVGAPKSEGVRDTILKLYPVMEELPIVAHNDTVLNFIDGEKRDELNAHKHLIDATASQVVFNALCATDLPADLHIVRTEIADEGRIGLLSIEGAARNPRLDELQASLFDAAIEDKRISSWLTRVQTRRDEDVGSGLEEIQIGLSCSSATMRLADEVVSLHAAVVTRRLRPFLTGKRDQDGSLAITYFSEDGTVQSGTKVIRPFIHVPAHNDASWTLHIAGGVRDTMFDLLRRASPREIGGTLIGQINFKRKIVYVTRLLGPPKDSRGSAYAFYRGVQDLPESIKAIEQRTGGLLGYIGEWHTHPMGGAELSEADIEAVENLREMLDRVPLPTLVTIVTPDGIHPHFFEADSPRYEMPRARRLTIRDLFGGLFFKHRGIDR